MHDIEQKIILFLEQACEGKAAFSEELVQEFGERCKTILRKSFVEEPKETKKFTLRMSNIGRSIRQLLLSKANQGAYKVSTEAKLRFTIGHMMEAFMLVLLKQSGVKVDDHDKQVMLPVNDTKIYGTYDVKIDGKIYDIKTASPFSYDIKFADAKSLKEGDSFGYFAQGFGYALADGSPFGGWIVINKATGEFKVVEINKYEHDALQKEYKDRIAYVVDYVNNDRPIPPCNGVIDETFNRVTTGNKILNSECAYCDFKQQCHKNIQCLPALFSKAKEPKLMWYVDKIFKPKDAA